LFRLVAEVGWRRRTLLMSEEAEVVSFLNPYQSGFQPTVEPTGFQPVVVQLSFSRMSVDTDRQKANAMTHSFTLILANVRELTVEMADAIFEAGGDNASSFSSEGVVSVHFAKQEGSTFDDAVRSATEVIERAGYQVAAVEADET
jgi:hypothetical protein